MDNQSFHNILRKYLKGKTSPEEGKIVEEFYQKNQDKELFDEYSPEDEDEVRNKLKSRVMMTITKKPSKKPRDKFLRVAASVVLLVTAGCCYFFLNTSGQEVTYITKTTEKGQHATIKLSDGTEVKLNAMSSITYPTNFDDFNTRNISLSGEAFFEVERNPDKPFIIQTDELMTTVLGTSFNIHAYPDDDIRVTVATGKVQVELNDQLINVLAPEEQAIYNRKNETINVARVELKQLLAWKDQIINFDDIPLSKAVEILERWYNVSIVFKQLEIGECYIDGSYKKEHLYNILESLKFVHGLSYEFQSERKILITGIKCK